ncbi:OmpA family protein [Vibrio profundum]|uniref:OmpA family protein n=1 Tax=Vibrio profundum TaxID=2910247 RepID=UPI003D133FB0
MPNLTVFQSRVYLLGAYFINTVQPGEIDGSYSNWNEQADLTSVSELSNVRPIPFTPIMVMGDAGSADNPPRLWGSNEDALICNLSYHDMPDPIQPDQEGARPADDTEGTILRHHSPVHTLEVGQKFPLIMPTTKLIGQLADRQSGVDKLADIIKQLYIGVPKNSLHTFTVSKVKLSQLAPAFAATTGEQLTDEQQSYNDWLAARHAESKHLPEPGIIYGIVIPAVQALGVVFSSDLYIGAEVSLVKPVSSLDASANEKEIVLAVSEVTKPYLESDTDRKSEKGINPSAMFVLPSYIDHNGKNIAIEDGYYLLRIKFWKTDYLKENTELNGHFPESIKTGRLKLEKSQVRPGSDHVQDVYTYELYEKVTFKSLSGFGQLACVCGDLISLEECLIYQFPESLPSYDQFMSAGASDTSEAALNGTGIKTYSLFSAVRNYSTSLAQGYAKGVNPFQASVGRGIAKGIWAMIKDDHLPPQITAGATALLAFDAFQTSYDKLKKAQAAVVVPEEGAFLKTTGKQLIQASVVNTDALKGMITDYKALYQEQGLTKTFAKLSKTWVKGQLKKDLAKALPGVTNGFTAYDIYEKLEKIHGMEAQCDQARQEFHRLAQDYLAKQTIVSAYHHWAASVVEAHQSLGLNDASEQFSGAHIVQEKSGIVIRLYFRFNNDEIPNQDDELHSDIEAACEHLSALLKSHPDYKLRIDGHAGRIGSQKANNQVASQRAEHIKNAIVHADSNPADVQADLDKRIFTFSYGNSQPITSDDVTVNMQQTPDDSPLAIDRRVEVRVIIPNYDITLPPSRTGMLEMEKGRQIVQGWLLGLNQQEAELRDSVYNLVLGIVATSATVFAPVASLLLVAKSSSVLADSAVSFIFHIIQSTDYSEFKRHWAQGAKFENLSKAHFELLRAYKDIQVHIEARFSTAKQIETHLKKSVTAKELEKRFLLRALALNGLVELMAYITFHARTPDERERKLQEYCVPTYIKMYVLNDNWEAPLNSSNTFAQDWLDKTQWLRINPDLPLIAGGITNNNWSVHGTFNIGFPVQTCLYSDSSTGLNDFSLTFDNSMQELNADDIGFSRLLIMTDRNDETSWQPFSYNNNLDTQQRIGPFTRVKMQVVLTKEASEDTKKVFKAVLSYGLDQLLKWGGPSFEVFLASRELKELTYKKGDELEEYFYGQDSLKAVEFEPTYWFGDYQISGLKPLYPWFTDALFDRWKSSGAARSTPYYFALDDHKLDLEYTREAWTNISSLTYGVDSGNTWGEQCKLDRDGKMVTSGDPFVVYDGLFNQSVVLNEADLLVHDFVVSENAQKTSGVPQYLNHQTGALCALEINGKCHWLNASSKTYLSDFSWAYDEPMSLVVAIVSNGTNQATYNSMGLDASTIKMKLALNVEKGLSWLFQDHNQGPNYFGELVYAGDVEYGELVTTSQDGSPHMRYSDVEIKRATDIATRWDSFLADVNSQINDKPEQYLQGYSGKAQLHFVKFELNYVSPTGKKVEGLRPFGPILDKEEGKIDQSTIAIHGLYQEGLEPSAAQCSVIKPDSFEVILPECSSFTEGVPWVEIESDASRADANAANYWREKMLGEANAQRRKEWLIEWIEKKPEIRVAPEPTTLAG